MYQLRFSAHDFYTYLNEKLPGSNWSSPEIVEDMDRLKLKAGQKATFTCRVTGQPSPDIQWFKDGQVKREKDRFLIK